MRKLLLIPAIALLAACQSEAHQENAAATPVNEPPEAVASDLAAAEETPKTASGKEVDRSSLQAAFDADCPDTNVQNASCKTTDDPTQFRCDYALKGDNVFNLKHVTITENGDSWKLNEIPNHCAKQ